LGFFLFFFFLYPILSARLAAGARNLPFLPTRGAIGTDLVAQNPANLRLLEDPFGGPPVLACRKLVPDVALIHAHRADRQGNVQYEPTILWPDIGIMPKAARRVIVSAEEIVDGEELRRHPERTLLPGFVVDAVVAVPYGAHPTSFFPRYGYDAPFHRAWAAAARDDAAARDFLERFVTAPPDQAAYLEAVGGAATLQRIAAWEEA
jgi:glutaconate CoA-transferase subunit A